MQCFAISVPVTTRTTPGLRCAADTSIDLIAAWA
jgi:hypothetical protein